MDDQTTDPTARQPTPATSSEPLAPAPVNVPPPSQPAAPPSPAPSSWDAPRQHRNEGGRWVGMFFGLVLLTLGLWFFAEKTLGLDMPDIHWGQFWPVILIVIGVLVLLSATRRERR